MISKKGIELSPAYVGCFSNKSYIIYDRQVEKGLSIKEISPEINKIQKDCFSEHQKEDSIKVLSLLRKEARKEATEICNEQGIY